MKRKLCEHYATQPHMVLASVCGHDESKPEISENAPPGHRQMQADHDRKAWEDSRRRQKISFPNLKQKRQSQREALVSART